MFKNLKLRTKLVAIVAPPLVVLAVVAAYSVLLSSRGANSVDELSSDIRTLGVVALASLLLSALTVLVVGRTITDPLEDVSKAARELADTRLPALLETIKNPGMAAPTFEPLTGGNNDEMANLVSALNAVQDGIAGLAVQQRNAVREGLSELVVNLARRNQSLLDRQIEIIDSLESNEEDPDRLEELFGLDHLATRMRRNAESLLVVAGAESVRRRGGPVAIADVLRVAMSEIEDYRHVQLASVEDAQIGAQGAVDLAHLFSEVLENATQFSPPDSPVEVTGISHPDGSYLISCVDHGIGMTADQLANANDVLQNPPELGLGLTRSLGFIVVGRLAQRLGVNVELMHTASGGITAIADVPASVLAGSSAPNPVTALDAAPDEPSDELEPQPPADSPSMPPAPAPALDAGLGAGEESWTPPPMPERGENPFGTSDVPFETQHAVSDNGLPPAPAFAPTTEFPAVAEMPPAPEPAPAMAEMPPPPPPPAPAEAAPAAFETMPEAPTVPDMPPASEMPMPEAPAAEAPPAPIPGMPSDAPQSEALAKLLGLAPTNFDEPPSQPTEPTAPSESSSMMFGRPLHEAAAPEPDAPWDSPVFDPSALEVSAESIPLAEPPAKLEEAIPTGESFESGMDSLLEPEAGRTSSGLVKRDRSKNHAPVSEGRPIAASVRSPDEIRSMLARYRSGLKGKPLSDLATPPMPTEANGAAAAEPVSYDSFNPGPFGSDTFGGDTFGGDSFDTDDFQQNFDSNGENS